LAGRPPVVTAVGPEADGWIWTSRRAVRPDVSNSPAMSVGSLRPKALYVGRPEIPRRELFRRSATPAGLSRCPFLTLPEGLVSVSNPCGGTGGPGGRLRLRYVPLMLFQCSSVQIIQSSGEINILASYVSPSTSATVT